MIAFWIALPLALRYAVLAVAGLLLGSAANFAIYRFAWFRRPIGPWGQPHDDVKDRRWVDRIPVVGWLAMRREASLHGAGFWIRPLLIEVALACWIPALYWFETQSGQLLVVNNNAEAIWLNTVFASHLVLVSLMVAATFIDFDEQTIPDLLTIPGTLIALIFAAFSLNVYLPCPGPNNVSMPCLFFVPRPLDVTWMGPTGWWTGFGIWTLWCFALANRRVITRRGWAKALEYFFASLVRYPSWKFLLAMWFVGFVLIRWVYGIGGTSWIGLLTALVGLGVGGGVVWAIRIVGSAAMRREALGFGDVTLMAMIGAFIGWQGAVMSFFLAPIAAIAIVLIYYIITRNSEIPFGPYLCAGTLLTVMGWERLVIGWFLPNLAILGPFMLWLFVALTGIMGVMLFFWRLIKESFLSE